MLLGGHCDCISLFFVTKYPIILDSRARKRVVVYGKFSLETDRQNFQRTQNLIVQEKPRTSRRLLQRSPLLLIHHTGAHSSKPRVNPVMYLADGERYLVFASNNRAKNNPDWYYNLKAHPDTQIEVGDDTIEVRAEELSGVERDILYERQASLYPRFAKYQPGTKRKIPVMALTKRKTF